MNDYIRYVLKCLGVTVFSLIFFTSGLYSQTCCSGGVPLSGNIGFTGAEKGTLQAEISYDLNYLQTLKNEWEVYPETSRKRVTQSILLKSGYSINSWLSVDALFSYVSQEREITILEETYQVRTSGIGDAVILPKITLARLSQRGYELQLGSGLKVPLGRTDHEDERGIVLNADMQPGSGTWDVITWAYYARQFNFRPSLVVSARVLGRFNGKNRKYYGSQTYQFGTSSQIFLSLGDQFLLGNRVLAPSLSLRYRWAANDRINEQELENTGGQWINVIPALSWHFRQNIILHMVPEIPLFSRVNGTQLTPTFRMQLGIYYRFGMKNNDQSKNYSL